MSVTRDQVLLAFVGHDRTAEEIANRFGHALHRVAPRITELLKEGRLEETGERRPTLTGRSAKVLRLKTACPPATAAETVGPASKRPREEGQEHKRAVGLPLQGRPRSDDMDG